MIEYGTFHAHEDMAEQKPEAFPSTAIFFRVLLVSLVDTTCAFRTTAQHHRGRWS